MKNLFFISLLVVALNHKAQELARRPFLGIQMDQITEDTKRVMELPSTKGVLISKVIPSSTAEQAGFKVSDVLLKINGKEINTPAEGTKMVASYKGGDEFTFEVIRDKKIFKSKSTFKEMKREEYAGMDVLYTATRSTNGIQRLIVSKPKNNKKAPAIVFIGGIGCYSLDSPFDTTRNETQFLNTLTRAGYVCVRAEKPGVGDNTKCKPCAEVSFKEELDGYINAVKTVKNYPYVDSNNVYVFGHSMGGLFAPLVAQQTNLKGIIAYGTIGSNFIEYLLKTRRTIAQAYNWSMEETDDYVKDCSECSAYYFVEKMTTEQAAAKKSICKEYLSVFDYRSRKYNDELYDFNIPAVWKPFKGKALLIWGKSDYVSAKEDHEIITKAINDQHPGNATFIALENADHPMNTAVSFQEARTNPGTYNRNVGTEVLQWLKRVI